MVFQLGEYKYNHAKNQPCAVYNRKSNVSGSTSENSLIS